MRRRRLRGAAALTLPIALVAGCRSARPIRPAPPPVSPTALDVPYPGPVPGIRIGVAMSAPRVSVSAPSGVRVWGARGGPRAPRNPAIGGAWDLPRVTAEALEAAAVSRTFEVQVANVASEEAAAPIAARAETAAGRPASVLPGGGGFRVRVGPFAERGAADRARRALASAGFADAWVTAAGAARTGGRLRVWETGGEAASLLVLPLREGELLEVDGVRYRGGIGLRPAPDGGVDAINSLDLEEYLRGVVPRELSPTVFPELEALKAQAVAARTYAARHRGGFEERGFDLCATPACQVYGGADAEQPLSDRAVAETRGIVALYEGRPIDALYTSTCGGHTEDVENIFSARDPAPWLRGVACTAERATWIELQAAPPRDPNGDRALLRALGLWPAEGAGPAGGSVLARVVAALPAAIGRRACASAAPSIDTRGQLFAALVDALCWGERAALLAPGEVEYLLPPGEAWTSEGERQRAAVLLGAGVLPGGLLRPDARPDAAQAAALLAAAIRAAEPERLREERVAGLGAGRLEVRRGEGIASLPLDPALRLVRRDAGGAAAVAALTLIPGETVTLVAEAGRVTYLEMAVAREGPAWDRGSRYHAWRVSLTPEEVASHAAEVGWSGPLLDVIPERRGVSGRVVEARIVGPAGERRVRGLDVRRALGLRESLLAIERDRAADGRVVRFHFTGRGWGHGVGLCQVGAFGMARAGHRYDAILRHYYTGIQLGPLPE